VNLGRECNYRALSCGDSNNLCEEKKKISFMFHPRRRYPYCGSFKEKKKTSFMFHPRRRYPYCDSLRGDHERIVRRRPLYL